MSLGKKSSVQDKKKKLMEAKKREAQAKDALRPVYKEFLESDAGKDFVTYLDTTMGEYLTRAMSEPDRDKKATLVDTASGVGVGRRYLASMSIEKVEEESEDEPVDT